MKKLIIELEINILLQKLLAVRWLDITPNE